MEHIKHIQKRGEDFKKVQKLMRVYELRDTLDKALLTGDKKLIEEIHTEFKRIEEEFTNGTRNSKIHP